MRLAIGFTKKALTEVAKSELESFAKNFPCNVVKIGNADIHTPTWGIEGDTEGWRQDYLIYQFKHYGKKANEPKEEIMSKERSRTPRNIYCLTNTRTNRPVKNKYTAFCPKADRVIGKPLTEYAEAKDLAIQESKKGVTVKLEYFKVDSREFTEIYLDGKLVERIDKLIKIIEE